MTDAVAYYSNAAEGFHASYRDDANRLERVRVWNDYFDRFLDGARSGYDMGCGSGILACELARRGVQMTGIDGAAGMLAIAEQEARRQQLGNIGFQQHRLPIADTNEFPPVDVIISSSALEYLDSMPEALLSLGRMLRPDGVLLFSVSNAHSISRKAVRLVHSVSGRPAYFGLLKQFMTVPQIQASLQATGFKYLTHSYFAKADRINRFLSKVFPERQSSNMIIVAARRI